MVKEKKNGPIEEKDLFNIFMDGGSSQFESQLLKSKKKLLNAKVFLKIILERQK